jgi:hypothetical protein
MLQDPWQEGINDRFKVSNVANWRGWHTGMRVIDILDQVNNIYGNPTSSAIEANNNIFRSLYLTTNAPEVLFCRIEDCAKVALLATQVAVLTTQSQLTLSMAANTMQRQDQLYQHLPQQQSLLHASQHQILDQLAALMFNASDMG